MLDFEEGGEESADELPKTEGEVIEAGESEDDCAPRRTAPDPGAPTQQQIDDHEIDHMPYRCWCEACVAGRGIGDQHRSGPESQVPTISFDYLLVTKKGIKLKGEAEPENVLLKILVVKDSMSKMISAHVVKSKGTEDDGYAVAKLKRDIMWLGYAKLNLKSDNEPAIVALLQEVLRGLKVEAAEQVAEVHPAPYDSKGNGSVENAVRQVQGQVRTMKRCLEIRLRRRIPADHPVMAWIVKHASWILTIRVRGRDGKTPYERLRGKPFTRKGVGFGELCLFRLPLKKADDDDGKLGVRWVKGVFLGYDRITNEYVFHSNGKIGKSRAVQRVTLERRWSPEAIQEVVTSPYAIHVRQAPEAFFKRHPSAEVTARVGAEQAKIRDVNFRRLDFEKHGLTEQGCPKCRHTIDRGWVVQTTMSHSKTCRQRMREAIKGSGEAGRLRVAAADERLNHWAAAAGAAAARSEGEKVVQDVPSASGEDTSRFRFQEFQEAIDYEAEDDIMEETGEKCKAPRPLQRAMKTTSRRHRVTACKRMRLWACWLMA